MKQTEFGIVLLEPLCECDTLNPCLLLPLDSVALLAHGLRPVILPDLEHETFLCPQGHQFFREGVLDGEVPNDVVTQLLQFLEVPELEL